MKLKISCLLLPVLLLSLSNHSAASSKEEEHRSDFHVHLDLNYLIGGQIYNDNFLYNPGFSLMGSYGKQLTKKAFLGLGTGVVMLQDAVFTPVFLDFSGIRSSKSVSSLINIRAGYAPALSTMSIVSNCTISGGVFLSAGIGKRFTLGEKLGFAVMLAYQHQFGRMEYRVADANQYSEQLNFDMLSLGIKLILK